MKIYQFTGTTKRNVAMFDQPDGNRRPKAFLKKASGGEDMVEISSEARRLYQMKKVAEMHRARIGRLARIYEPGVKMAIREMEEDRNSGVRQEIVSRLRESVQEGRYPFDSPGRLAATSEMLLAQFSG